MRPLVSVQIWCACPNGLEDAGDLIADIDQALRAEAGTGVDRKYIRISWKTTAPIGSAVVCFQEALDREFLFRDTIIMISK